MEFNFKTTDFPFGHGINKAGSLLMIYYSKERKRDLVSQFIYPHISLVCSKLTEVQKASFSAISCFCEEFHISFKADTKVFRRLVPIETASVGIVVDNSRNSATLGITTQDGDRTLAVSDICVFLGGILAKARV